MMIRWRSQRQVTFIRKGGGEKEKKREARTWSHVRLGDRFSDRGGKSAMDRPWERYKPSTFFFFPWIFIRNLGECRNEKEKYIGGKESCSLRALSSIFFFLGGGLIASAIQYTLGIKSHLTCRSLSSLPAHSPDISV